MVKGNVNLTEYILERALSRNDADTRFNELTTLIRSISILGEQETETGVDLFQICSSLPTTNIQDNKLYLVYNEDGEIGNVFDVFVHIGESWEQLDSFEFNTLNYYTSNQLDGLLGAKASSNDLQETNNILEEQGEIITTATENIGELQEGLYGGDGYDFENPLDGTCVDNINTTANAIGTVTENVESVLSDMSDLQETVSDTTDTVEEVKTTVYGDENDNTDNGLVGQMEEVQSDIGTVQGNIQTINVQKIPSLEGQINSKASQSDLNTTNTNLNTTNTNIGNVSLAYGGNLQNQIATLLTLFNNLINCVVVDTVQEMENLNVSYTQYCYVRDTGKYYAYAHYVKYFDENDNEVTPIGGDDILISIEASDKEIENINKIEQKLGVSQLYG